MGISVQVFNSESSSSNVHCSTMRSSNLPRWENNYAPFYCPENPLPRRPRRPPSAPPPLIRPVVRNPRPTSASFSSSSSQRRGPGLSYQPVVPRRQYRYGPNLDELPSDSFRIFGTGGNDRNSEIIGRLFYGLFSGKLLGRLQCTRQGVVLYLPNNCTLRWIV